MTGDTGPATPAKRDNDFLTGQWYGPWKAADFVADPAWDRHSRPPTPDLYDEYARRVGHADLLREAVDGLVGEDRPQR